MRSAKRRPALTTALSHTSSSLLPFLPRGNPSRRALPLVLLPAPLPGGAPDRRATSSPPHRRTQAAAPSRVPVAPSLEPPLRSASPRTSPAARAPRAVDPFIGVDYGARISRAGASPSSSRVTSSGGGKLALLFSKECVVAPPTGGGQAGRREEVRQSAIATGWRVDGRRQGGARRCHQLRPTRPKSTSRRRSMQVSATQQRQKLLRGTPATPALPQTQPQQLVDLSRST
ncbi:uncharacterized protein LOC119342175 [Triticum dicoccoides]|uniref:uncharacterized protein LOC119342175 n=1 Tax=Triticum dicoccoides TaxID=85692 RepID=UPI000E7B4E60|nr:uncharacterized protein LOC119342175 [Triticum dicoccoides]